MKKKILNVVMSVSMAFSLLAPVAVHANSIGAQSIKAENNIETKADDSTTTPSATAADESTGRSSRIETYKKSLTEVLSTASKTRITERCTAAQANIKGKMTSDEAIFKARQSAYDSIIGTLQSVVTTASDQTADVTALQANISVLQAKIVSFKTANTTYNQALTDLSLIDCKTDPTGFKAALEVSRIDQQAVFASAKDIRTYLNDTVKPTLKELKTKLKS